MLNRWRRRHRAALALPCVLLVSACDSSSITPPVQPPPVLTPTEAPVPKIEHVIFMLQENRSFDHYFGRFPGADGSTKAILSDGTQYEMQRPPDFLADGIAHDASSLARAVHGGRLDRFDLNPGARQGGQLVGLTVASEEDIPNYYQYAKRFVLGDRFFASSDGPTFPNHLFFVAGQSMGVISNPEGASWKSWGCKQDLSARVTVLRNGIYSSVYPCFRATTTADLLNDAGLPWKFYGPPEESSWRILVSFDAIEQIRLSPDYADRVVSTSKFIEDVESGHLPAVSWVVDEENEHPPLSICRGENGVVSRINAVMKSKYWNNTAIFVSWDDAGGFYDHVIQPKVDEFGYGLRVPLLVISPYAKAGTIFHNTGDFSSVLRFIGRTFNLPRLSVRESIADDFYGTLDLRQKPLEPVVLPLRACPAGALSPDAVEP